jgi:hypothetical protein
MEKQTEKNKANDEIDIKMNHLILRSLQAEENYLKIKLEELHYYRHKIIKLRKFRMQ